MLVGVHLLVVEVDQVELEVQEVEVDQLEVQFVQEVAEEVQHLLPKDHATLALLEEVEVDQDEEEEVHLRVEWVHQEEEVVPPPLCV